MELISLACIEILRWLSAGPRSHAETMERWGTSPQVSIAFVDGLIALDGSMVQLTERGKAILEKARP